MAAFRINTPLAWEFQGKVQDKKNSAPLPACALCGHPMRFAFIVHSGSHSAKVGAECVMSCRIQRLDGESAPEAEARVRAQMTTLKKNARKNRLLDVLITLKDSHPDVNLRAAIRLASREAPLSPAMANFVLSLAERSGLSCGNDLLRISLNKKEHLDQFKKLSEYAKIRLIDAAIRHQRAKLKQLLSG